MNDGRPIAISESRERERFTKEKDHFSFVELTVPAIRALLRPRDPYAHKGTFGHGLLVAGCDRMPGAAVLAATAAMRGGIGKLTTSRLSAILTGTTCRRTSTRWRWGRDSVPQNGLLPQ